RRSAIALTVIYGGIYFWSQADSYQHHYLIALLLLLTCFLPFDALPGLERPREGGWPKATRSWATALIYVQVGVVYLYTGITKSSPDWLSGWGMTQVVTGEEMKTFMTDAA